MHNIILKNASDMQKAKDLLVRVFNPGYYDIEGDNKIIFKSQKAHEIGEQVLGEIEVDMALAEDLNSDGNYEAKLTHEDHGRVMQKAMELVKDKSINLTDLATIELSFGRDQTIPKKYKEVMGI